MVDKIKKLCIQYIDTRSLRIKNFMIDFKPRFNSDKIEIVYI